MEDLTNIEVNSSPNELKKFMEGIIWGDLSREVRAWMEGFERELQGIVDQAAVNNPTTASFLLHMGDLNGRVKAAKYFLELPQILAESQQSIDEIEEDEDAID